MSAAFVTVRCGQGRNEGARGAQCPGRRIAGGAKMSQQCRKYFLQYRTFTSKRLQVRTWGRQTCFFPRTPSNVSTPLTVGDELQEKCVLSPVFFVDYMNLLDVQSRVDVDEIVTVVSRMIKCFLTIALHSSLAASQDIINAQVHHQ